MCHRRVSRRARIVFPAGNRARILFAAVGGALSILSGSARATDYLGNSFDFYFWQTPSEWSPTGVPGSGDSATVNNGEVFVNQQTAVDQLTLSSSATVDVAGNGTYGDVGLTVANSITNNGTINLEAIDGSAYWSTLSVGGTLTNNGTLNLSGAAPYGGREINGTVINNYAVYDAGQTTYLFGNVTNNNLYDRQSGGTTDVATGYTFTQQAYKLIIDPASTFNVYGATFIYAGGSVSGAVNFYDGGYAGSSGLSSPHLQTPVADGQGAAFNFYVSANLDTDLPTNTILNVIGNSTVGDVTAVVPQNFTNNGTINLKAQDGGYYSTLKVGDGNGTVTNHGTINLSGDAPYGGREIIGNVINDYAIYDAGQTTFLVGDVTNNNLYERQAGGTTIVAVTHTFTQNAYKLIIDPGSTFNVDGGTFIWAGGTISGPVDLYQANYPQSSGISPPHLQTSVADGQNVVFNLHSTGYLDTDFPVNTTLNVIANATVGDVALVVPQNFTNNGTINFKAQDGGYSSILQAGDGNGTITNYGTITLSGDAPYGGRQITGNVTNNFAIYDAGQTTWLADDVTNNNLYERQAGGTTNVAVTHTFTQSGYKLIIDPGGTFNVIGGTFNYAGGSVSGAVDLYQTYYPQSSGISYPQLQTSVADGQNAVFNLHSTGYLDTDFPIHTTLNVIANSTLGNVTLVVPQNFTNSGTITLNAQDGGYTSTLQAGDSTGIVTNSGPFGVINSSDDNHVGGAREITGSVINFGYIAVHTPLDIFGALTDQIFGTVAVDDGQALTLHGANFILAGGELSIGAGGSLSFVDGGQYIYEAGELHINGTFVEASQPLLSAGDKILVSGNGAKLLVGSGGILIAGGSIVSQGAGNIVSQGAGNIVSQGAGNIVSQGAGNLVALIGQDGSGIASPGLAPTDAGANIIADGGTITLNAGNAMADGNGIIENGGLLTGNGTFTAAAFDVDAASTIVATGGTLHLIGAINPYTAGTLTTGNWQVNSNSTLDTPNIGPITINQANVTLDGVGSVWTNINSLADNQGTFNVSGGRAFTAAGPFSSSGTLMIGAGSTFTATGPLTISGTLSVDPAGRLDLDHSQMILTYTGATPASAIRALLISGYDSGKWDGTGIDSTAAHTDTTFLTALGYLDTGTSILVKYTYYGDADLNGKVDGSDYSRIDSGYLSHAGGWYNGDFNYDGVIDGSDYTLIDNAFNTQGASLAVQIASPTAQIAGVAVTSTVPEPTTLGLLGIGAIGLLGRPSSRRRKILTTSASGSTY